MKERDLIAPHVAIELVALLLYICEIRGSNISWLFSVCSKKFKGVTKTISTPLLSTFFIIYYYY
jgi:hypothetical protein